MEKWIQFILRHRWFVIVAIIVITFFTSLKIYHSIEFDFSPESLFIFNDPDHEYYQEFKEVFGEGDNLIIPMFSRNNDEIFTLAFLRTLKDITRRIKDLDYIQRSVSLINAPFIRAGEDWFEVTEFMSVLPKTPDELADYRQRARASRIYRNQLISGDGRTLAMVVELETGFTDVARRKPVIARIKKIIQDGIAAAEAAEPERAPIEWHLAGVPIVEAEYSRILQNDLTTFVGLTVIAISLLLLVVFRNIHGIYIPLSAIATAVIWTLGILVFSGEKINVLTNTIPTLLLTIGVADSIHILARYYEEIGVNPDKRQALIQTVKQIGLACLLTSVTTAIGFGSLYTAKITVIKHFGLIAATGVMFAYAVNISWLPTVLSLHRPPQRGVKVRLDSGLLGRFMTACGRFAIGHRLFLSLMGLAIGFFSIVGVSDLQVQSYMMDELSHTNPVWIANNFAETHLTGVLSVDYSIDGSPGDMKDPAVLRGVETLQKILEKEKGFVTKTISLVDLLKEMNQAFHGGDSAYYTVPESRELVAQYLLIYESSSDADSLSRLVNDDYSRLRVQSLTTDIGSAYYFNFTKALQPRLKTLFPPMVKQVHITGSSPIAKTAILNLIKDMLSSLLTASLFIFIIMVFLFRSVKMGAISMIPTALPLLLTFGFMGSAGINMRTSTVLIFSVALGIAVDNTIHFMARFKDEIKLDGDYPAAIMRTTLSTGRAIVFTSLILVLGFSVMGTSSFIALQDLALLGSMTLLAGLFSSIFILPVCLLLFHPIKT